MAGFLFLLATIDTLEKNYRAIDHLNPSTKTEVAIEPNLNNMVSV